MITLKKHNRYSYQKVEEAMENSRHVVYISGVGTGKSFIFMKLLADSERYKGGRALYIVPQDAIRVNIRSYPEFTQIADRVDFINMQQFRTLERALTLFPRYDLVVMDEAHHLGSDIYGKHILEAVLKTGVPFLGLSATPLRADRVDIRDKFAVVVDGISNFDVIRLGLMPQFTYRIGVKDKDLASYRKRLQSEAAEAGNIKGKVIRERDYSGCTDVIRDIAVTYPRKKYIVFSTDIKALRRDRKVIEQAFDGKEIFEMHSACEDHMGVLDAFNEAESGILMTVDMALEGIHLPDIEGIVLLRNVQSIVAFEQMLGRVCAIGKEVSPVVIDCSARGVELLQKLLSDNDKNRAYLRELRRKLQMENVPLVHDIMHIAIGAHEEWKDVETFERAWAAADPARKLRISNEQIAEGIRLYKEILSQLPSGLGRDKDRAAAAVAEWLEIPAKELRRALQEQGF